MAKYNKIDPGLVDRIMKLKEKEQSHRQIIENKEIKIISRNSFLGILSGILISALFGILSF